MQRSTASLLIRDLPHYRREAFAAGLSAAGFSVAKQHSNNPRPGDVLVIWNRYGFNHSLAQRYEAAGARVVVVENGYLDFRGARKTFAMSLRYHNGAGEPLLPADADREAPEFDVELRPWCSDGKRGDVLLLPQRGIGPPGVAMPAGWLADVQRRISGRRVRIRPHPGGNQPRRALERDLEGVAVCVTWGSGAGLKALLAGVPVVHEMRHWIGADGGSRGLETLGQPRFGDREAMLRRIVRAQWTDEEVVAGVPFKYLREKETI